MSNSNTGYAHFVLFRIIHPYFVQYNDLFCLFGWFNLFLSVFSLWLIRIQTSIYFLFHQLTQIGSTFMLQLWVLSMLGTIIWNVEQDINSYIGIDVLLQNVICVPVVSILPLTFILKKQISFLKHILNYFFYIYLLNIDYIFHLLTKVSFRFSSSFLVSRILSY